MRKIVNKFLNKFGYMLAKSSLGVAEDRSYVLYRYVDRNGNFDYEKYKKTQTEGNRKKIDLVWANEENIQFLSKYIKNQIASPNFGICHGTRRGMEQQWFAKYLGCTVIGTEISDSAEQFPNTIQWDFHQVKPEWLNSVDFIYSNSFDHSYNPEECINAWMSCLKKDGICIIEHASGQGISGATELDPFGADLAIFPHLVLKWGRGKFSVRRILEAPVVPGGRSGLHFICIQNN